MENVNKIFVMRIGVNPEKLKNAEIKYWKHRIIIPVYIPNIYEDYYANAFQVLKKCIFIY